MWELKADKRNIVAIIQARIGNSKLYNKSISGLCDKILDVGFDEK